MSKRDDFFNAIQAGNLAAVKTLLLENSHLANAQNDAGVSALLIALYHNEVEIAGFLADVRRELTLCEAAALGQNEMLLQLLEAHPADVNRFSADGFQALGLAAFFNHEETARILLDAGAEVNTPSNNPFHVTPLHSAAASANLEIARLLLDNGADANARQQGGFTPLHAAAQNGQIEMATLLLEHGADVDALNDGGEDAIQLAKNSRKAKMAAFLAKYRLEK